MIAKWFARGDQFRTGPKVWRVILAIGKIRVLREV